MPLTPLLEPYLAALMEAVSTKNPLSSDEVEFLIKIAQYDSLGTSDALSLLSLFSHTYFDTTTYSGIILRPIIDLIERNRRNPGVKDFVEAQVNKACSTIINLKQEEKLLLSKARKNPTMKQRADQLERKMQRYYAIVILEELYELPSLQFAAEVIPPTIIKEELTANPNDKKVEVTAKPTDKKEEMTAKPTDKKKDVSAKPIAKKEEATALRQKTDSKKIVK